MQTFDQRAQAQRIDDDLAQILAGANFAGAELKRDILEALDDQIFLQRLLVLQILRRLAARHLIERRLGDIEMAALDQFRHLPEEEGQQQRADMGAVDVGVRHDDDLVIAQLVGVELVLADRRCRAR